MNIVTVEDIVTMRIKFSSVVLLVGVYSLSKNAMADDEGVAYTMGNFSGYDDACGGSNFTWHAATTNHLITAMSATWSFDRVSSFSHQGVNQIDMADVNEDPHGVDHVSPNGLDTFDVAMLYSHGSSTCSSSNYSSGFKMGNSAGDNECTLTLGANYSLNDMWMGDTDLNIMIIDTCQSLQKCVWDHSGYYANGNELNAILGFHGNSKDSSAHTSHFQSYVTSSGTSGLGDNWVDEMTDTSLAADNEECAIAITYGATSADRNYIYNNAGLNDWKTVTSQSSSAYYYISGCDPKSGPIL